MKIVRLQSYWPVILARTSYDSYETFSDQKFSNPLSNEQSGKFPIEPRRSQMETQMETFK